MYFVFCLLFFFVVLVSSLVKCQVPPKSNSSFSYLMVAFDAESHDEVRLTKPCRPLS